MDSINDGATIRIGFKEHSIGKGSFSYDFKTPTYSLKINKKSVLIFSGGREKEYKEIYRTAAREISKEMNKNDIKKYIILNGERVRFSNKQWVSCGYVPKDGEEIFKKTLEQYLK